MKRNFIFWLHYLNDYVGEKYQILLCIQVPCTITFFILLSYKKFANNTCLWFPCTSLLMEGDCSSQQEAASNFSQAATKRGQPLFICSNLRIGGNSLLYVIIQFVIDSSFLLKKFPRHSKQS